MSLPSAIDPGRRHRTSADKSRTVVAGEHQESEDLYCYRRLAAAIQSDMGPHAGQQRGTWNSGIQVLANRTLPSTLCVCGGGGEAGRSISFSRLFLQGVLRSIFEQFMSTWNL